MQNFEEWHLSFQSQKKIFFLFRGVCQGLKIYDRIWSADSTANITVIQSSKLSKLRSTFERVPLNFFNCSGWNSFNFYIYFWISLKNLDDLDVWPPFWARLFLAEIAKAKMKAKHQDHSNFLMKSKNSYKYWKNFTKSDYKENNHKCCG